MSGSEHVHNGALSALVGMSDVTKSELARRASMTPAQLADLISGRRAGTSEATRERVASALVDSGVPTCTVGSITCWCDDRARHAEVSR